MSRKGRIKNVKATNVDGIKYRSRLEAFTSIELRKSKIKFNYEKEKFVLMDKFKYEGVSIEKRKRKGKLVYDQSPQSVRSITYVPDFTNLKQGWIIEVKGLKSDVFNVKWKLFKQYLAKNNLNYDLYMPGSKKQILETIKMIKEKIIISDKEKKKIKKMGISTFSKELSKVNSSFKNKVHKNKKKYSRKSKHGIIK
jgi:hypothetical protein|tara:strand:- start:210 stop:797 length:588 start_codon:yes stop_codon:yes gene_type:complete